MQNNATETARGAGADAVQRPNVIVAAPERTAVQGRSLVLTACLIATFVTAIESTIISTTLPTIVGELGGFDLFSWVFTIFLLTQAVSIPIYGRLADMFGRVTQRIGKMGRLRHQGEAQHKPGGQGPAPVTRPPAAHP